MYGFDSDDFDTDFEILCPRCGTETRSRDCANLGCDDGYIDDYEDDPLWFDPGDESECSDCHGTGIERWCPTNGCGWQWHGEVIDRDNRVKSTDTQEVNSVGPDAEDDYGK